MKTNYNRQLVLCLCTAVLQFSCKKNDIHITETNQKKLDSEITGSWEILKTRISVFSLDNIKVSDKIDATDPRHKIILTITKDSIMRGGNNYKYDLISGGTTDILRFNTGKYLEEYKVIRNPNGSINLESAELSKTYKAIYNMELKTYKNEQ